MRSALHLVIPCAILFASSCHSTEDASAPSRPDLTDRLLTEWQATEDVWERLARADELERRYEMQVEPEQLYLQLARQLTLDAELLEAVFDDVGWPTPALVGEDASQAALAMVVHAPPVSSLPARAEEQIERAGSFEGRDAALADVRDPAQARTRASAWIAPGPGLASLVVAEPVAVIVEPSAVPELPHAALAAELLAMQARDQEVRFEVAAALRNAQSSQGGASKMSMFLLVAKQKAVDSENLARLKEIVADIGWPTAELVGKEGARAAWILAQHADSDPDFQDEVLALITPLAGTDSVSYADVALLTDRLRVARGEPQRFATQWLSKPIDGVTHFGPSTPIEDPEHVDERRAMVGLPPLEEYLETLREVYGVPEDAPALPEDD